MRITLAYFKHVEFSHSSQLVDETQVSFLDNPTDQSIADSRHCLLDTTSSWPPRFHALADRISSWMSNGHKRRSRLDQKRTSRFCSALSLSLYYWSMHPVAFAVSFLACSISNVTSCFDLYFPVSLVISFLSIWLINSGSFSSPNTDRERILVVNDIVRNGKAKILCICHYRTDLQTE